MIKKDIVLSLGALAVVVLLLVGGIKMLGNEPSSLGSVAQGGEYNATSTAASNGYGAFTGDQLLKTGWGILGSVVITGANTGVVNILNATTTDITLRTGNTATTSILIASIPASAAAGTYTFDVVFTTGLFIDLDSGLMPTTTITYR